MPRTTRQVGLSEGEIARGCTQRCLQIRIARDRRPVRDRGERAAPDPRRGRRRFALTIDGRNEAPRQGRTGRARIDDETTATRHDIRRRRFDGENADGGDEIVGAFAVELFGDTPHDADGIGRGNQRVAQMKRRRAGMVGLALEDDLDAADADDRRDHADIERLRFKDDSLLDNSRKARMSVRWA